MLFSALYSFYHVEGHGCTWLQCVRSAQNPYACGSVKVRKIWLKSEILDENSKFLIYFTRLHSCVIYPDKLEMSDKRIGMYVVLMCRLSTYSLRMWFR